MNPVSKKNTRDYMIVPYCKLAPSKDEVPAEFIKDYNPYYKLAQEWFFTGIDNKMLGDAKPGIDRSDALWHIKRMLESFDPPHEDKMAAAAYLISEWFQPNFTTR